MEMVGHVSDQSEGALGKCNFLQQSYFSTITAVQAIGLYKQGISYSLLYPLPFWYTFFL